MYIGLDAGGSNTELLAHVSPEEDRFADNLHLRGPGANPARVGMEEATRRLADLIRQALRRCPGVPLHAVCAGVAGIGGEENQRALAARLRHTLDDGDAPVQVVHDVTLALETAFGNGSGLVVVAGTGSVLAARTERGEVCRSGGWGHVLGDEGSGYALGRAGLRAVSDALDGGPATRLQSLLAEENGMDSRAALNHWVYHAEQPIQDVAVHVLRAAAADDPVAARILNEQTTLLARQVSWLAERCASGPLAAVAPRVRLFGGLTNNATYVSALRGALHDCLPDWSARPASDPPVTGALQLARAQKAPVALC